MSRSIASLSVADDRQAGALCPACQREANLGDELAVCQACGAVHHRRCWETAGGCAAYACAPSRRDVAAGAAAAIEITPTELSTAVPLPRRSAAALAGDRWAVPPLETPRTSRLAVGAFVTAMLGIPLFGIVTGLLAIILGCTALSAMAGSRLKGSAWAVCGILVGLFDMTAWVIGLALYFGGGPQTAILEFQPDVGALSGLTPEINRAMRANVSIESHLGLGRGGIGSGVILQIADGEALVMTNRHVIDANHASKKLPELGEVNAHNILLKMIGQGPEPARVVWIAPAGVDAALVRVRCATDEAEATRWTPAAPMHVGDPVFAIGNPHNLGWTHTQGSISQFRTQGEGPSRIRVIQTQTAINPGNSGGGLYDRGGNLIGINTWTNDKRYSEGISFAIAFESLLALRPPGLSLPPAAAGDDQP